MDTVVLKEVFTRMTGCLAVIVIFSFWLTWYWEGLRDAGKKPHWHSKLLVGLLFGFIAIYGTLGGFKLPGTAALVNIRDIAPLIGGLYFSPTVAIVSAIIGATFRIYMGLDGDWLHDTTIPCAIAVVVAGCLGAGLGGWLKHRPRITTALTLGLSMSVLHIVINYIYNPKSWDSFFLHVWHVWMLFYALGILTYAFSAAYLFRARDRELSKRVLDHEYDLARKVQNAALPAVQALARPEMDWFALLAPTRQMRGDFYDCFAIAEQRVVFLVGKISGKNGMAAATQLALMRGLLRAADWRTPVNEVVVHINHAATNDDRGEMFVTLFVGVLDLATGDLEFCNCGHTPPLLPAGDREKHAALGAVGSAIIGSTRNATYLRQRDTLAPGETLLLYTDGLTDAETPKHDRYGEERLRAGWERLRDAPTAQAAVVGVFNDVAQFTDHLDPTDDRTALCVRYLGGKK